MPYKQYFERTQFYLNQINDISSFIGDRPFFISRESRREAQAMMKILKDEINNDCKIAKSVRKMKGMSHEERQFFSTALNIKAKLKVRINSDPIRSNWFSCLYDCRNEFQAYIDYLSSKHEKGWIQKGY
jgi:hypothetical protein